MRLAETLVRAMENIRTSQVLQLESQNLIDRVQDTLRMAVVLRRLSELERTRRAKKRL